MSQTTDEVTLNGIFGLQGRAAIVTGGGSGIGRAVCELFATAGARVVVADIDGAGAAATTDVLNAKSREPRAVAAIADLADESSVTALYAAATEAFGTIGVVVNAAGIFPKYRFVETTVAQFDRIQAVNLRGVFLSMREAFKHMQATGKGGSIINISSASSLQAMIFHNSAYSASKAGVNALTKTIALEGAAHGIRVNAILPGGVETPGSKTAMAGGPPGEGPAYGTGRFPMGRVAQPIEIANAALFLASAASSYITGQLLVVDGGYLIS